MPDQALPKLIVIVGPTASGKTDWSLRIAKKYNGEIISADSRQVYKHMDIGTAKVEGEWKWKGMRKIFCVENIPHYLIDFLSPKKKFTVSEFRSKALKGIAHIRKRGAVPMIVGGTGLYVQSVIDNFDIPHIKPHKKLRAELEQKTNEVLFEELKTLDPVGAERIDKHNKRRLIRALEVCMLSGVPFSQLQQKGKELFDLLIIAPKAEREVYAERINKRVDGMIKNGLIEEITKLRKKGYKWSDPGMSGIGYKQFKDFFEGEETLEEAVDHLKHDTRQFAKRQMTWFKRDSRIHWCTTFKQADKLVADFLGN